MENRLGISFYEPHPPAGSFVAAGRPDRIEYLSSCHCFLEAVDVFDNDVYQLADSHVRA